MIGRRYKLQQLAELRDPQCRKCPLGGMTQGNVCVLGRGNVNAPVMLVGEAPGEAEARTGKPFMGAAGQLLNRMLTQLGMTDDVYITNVCRCRPPKNRKPTQLEMDKCVTNYLNEEFRIVNPRVIVAMGATAKSAIAPGAIRGKTTISAFVRGSGDEAYVDHVPVVYTYHPAAPLYAGHDPSMIRQIVRHLKMANEMAARATPGN